MYTGEVTCQESQFFHWVSKAPCIFITVSIDQEAEETTLRETGRKDGQVLCPALKCPLQGLFPREEGGALPGAEPSDALPCFLGT